MKKILVIVIVLVFSNNIKAHPGIGIVKDSKGNIFYTDLEQVWRISRDGRKTIAVPRVHSHELFMDAEDNLYGEHLWYNGEKLDTWGHYVWRLRGDGRLDTVIDPSEGFLENYSFVRDIAGNMYWAERFKISRIKKRTTTGKIETIAEGKFKDIRWMYATAQGIVYFIDLFDLYRIDPGGAARLVAEDINSKTNLFGPITSSRHDLMGIWTDKEDNIYVANFGGQVVKKIGTDGTVSKVAFSSAPWSPTGGLIDEKGDLWLLEYSVTNECRVRKIPEAELGKQGDTALLQFNNDVLPLLPLIGFVAFSVLLIVIAVRTVKKKARSELMRSPVD
jgi:hypothetical protein